MVDVLAGSGGVEVGSDDRPRDRAASRARSLASSKVFSYGTAAAFRAAPKNGFAAIAKSGRLKRAGALVARLESARHSKDIDLFYAEQLAPIE